MLLYILVFWTKPKSISNSTNFSEGGQRLTWIQRLSAAIGVVKGIQFLHGGIMPGLFSNDLKVTNIFLDQNLVAKISSYNLPVLAENMITMVKIKILHPSRLCCNQFDIHPLCLYRYLQEVHQVDQMNLVEGMQNII